MIDISIIMPVYNTELYLAQSIESVINQTNVSLELICIDDGSEDDSLNILRKYENLYPQIRVVVQPHSGLSIARNTGIHLAKGRYIYFMDSDDYLEDKAISYMVEMCDKNSLDVLFMSFRNVCEDISLNEKYATMLSGKKRKHSFIEPIDGQSLFCRLMEVQEYYCMVWCYCCSSSFLRSSNILFPKNIYYEDQSFTYSVLFYAMRASCVDRIIYNKRIRDGSICVDNDLQEYEKGYLYNISFFEKMIEKIEQTNSPYYDFSQRLLMETKEKLSRKMRGQQSEFDRKIVDDQ